MIPICWLDMSFSLVKISLHVELRLLGCLEVVDVWLGTKKTAKKQFYRISAGAVGGPRSRFTGLTLDPLLNTSGNLLAHMSAKSPTNISTQTPFSAQKSHSAGGRGDPPIFF